MCGCGWDREWDERKTRDKKIERAQKTMVMRVCVCLTTSRGGAFTRASPSYCTRHTRPHTRHVWLVPNSPAQWVESMWLTCSQMIKKERSGVCVGRRCAVCATMCRVCVCVVGTPQPRCTDRGQHAREMALPTLEVPQQHERITSHTHTLWSRERHDPLGEN